MTWTNLRLLVLTSPPDPDLDALAAALDAVVLRCAGDPLPVASVNAARPELPLVVLTDAGPDTVPRLLAAGADEVLPQDAAIDEIVRAIERASSRKQRAHAGWNGELPLSGAARARLPQLEAAGRLAGGVAQDFNNLLMIIEGNAERLLMSLPADHPQRERVKAIASASRRGVVLTQKLLAFGRRQPLKAAPVDLSVVVNDCVPLLRRRLGPKIALTTTLERNSLEVRVDRAHIVQILSSLTRIAAESMPHGGSFTITGDTVVAAAEMRRDRPWLPAGRYVRLRFADSGEGIAPDVLPRVFEPFLGRNTPGNGLDFPSVYGLVKQSGGFIWAHSQPGQGTCITILLPPLGAAEEHAGLAAASAPKPHVLLVEDDDEVRELLIDVLTSHGMRVTPVSSAEEALRVEPLHRFDLLMTDIGLPGATGPELAREVRSRSPRLPVLFISGQSGDIFEDEEQLDSPSAFLQKPFSSRALVASVQELLKPSA